jgi:hypothetical protein
VFAPKPHCDIVVQEELIGIKVEPFSLTQFFHIGLDPLVLSNSHKHVKIREKTLCTKLRALIYLPTL